MRHSLKEVKKRAFKERECWWLALAIRPIATRLVYLLHGYEFITPNRLTMVSLLVAIPGIVFFFRAADGYIFIVLGVIFFNLFYVFDCMDGGLARVRGNVTKLGTILDSAVGGVVLISYMATLTTGGYNLSGSDDYLFAGILWFGLVALSYIVEYSAERLGINKNTIVEFIESEEALTTTAGEPVATSPIARFTSFMAKRRLLPYPTDIELFVIVFGIAPLIRQILIGIYIAAGFYLIRLIIKLLVVLRRLDKGE